MEYLLVLLGLLFVTSSVGGELVHGLDGLTINMELDKNMIRVHRELSMTESKEENMTTPGNVSRTGEVVYSFVKLEELDVNLTAVTDEDAIKNRLTTLKDVKFNTTNWSGNFTNANCTVRHGSIPNSKTTLNIGVCVFSMNHTMNHNGFELKVYEGDALIIFAIDDWQFCSCNSSQYLGLTFGMQLPYPISNRKEESDIHSFFADNDMSVRLPKKVIGRNDAQQLQNGYPGVVNMDTAKEKFDIIVPLPYFTDTAEYYVIINPGYLSESELVHKKGGISLATSLHMDRISFTLMIVGYISFSIMRS